MIKSDGVGDPDNLVELLLSEGEDFLLRNNGNQIPVSELQGKIACMYFIHSKFRSCHEISPILADIYHTLKERGEGFEIVSIPFQESLNIDPTNMPWFALPYNTKTLKKLSRKLKISAIPTLVVIGSDGKTLHLNARRYINLYGIEAYPFSMEKLAELDEIDKKRLESLTLESLLVCDGLDFVEGKGGVKVPVSELNGKTVLFYLSKKECDPCKKFTPKLEKAYSEIKEKHDDLEVIYVCLDNDRKTFEEHSSSMPWLLIPYGDERERFVKNIFDFGRRIPYLVAVGPSGGVLAEGARELVIFFGSDAYPFDKHRVDEMESKLEEMAKGWPEKVKNTLHPPHELVWLSSGIYTCDGCGEMGHEWIFGCREYHYGLHPGCALKDNGIKGIDKSHDDRNYDNCKGSGTHDSPNEVSSDRVDCDGAVCYGV